MDYQKKLKVKDYFKIHNYYAKIYGVDRTILLMQVGSFHECYCTLEDGLDLVSLAKKLDVVCTKKNNKINEVSRKNPRMLGFPVRVVGNFMQQLLDLNYTVVLVDQVTEPPNPEREVTGIYSPGTYLDNQKLPINNFLVSLVFDYGKDKSGSLNLIVGMVAYDLTTGKGSYFESQSVDNDKMYALDDTVRFLSTYPGSEIVVMFLNDTKNEVNQMNHTQMYQYLNINPEVIYKARNKANHKISYQNEYFGKVFEFQNQLSVIENLEMEFLKWSRLALLNLLEYASSHQSKLVRFLKKPEPFVSNQFLHLGNNALQQLNVLESEKHLHYDNSVKSLYDVVNCASSCLGKRFLKKTLSSPLISSSLIEKRLKGIDYFIKDKIPKKIEEDINSIYDLERLERRWVMNMIHPYQLSNLFQSYQSIINILTHMDPSKYNLFDLSLEKLEKTNELIEKLNSKFDWNKMNNVVLTDTKESFFNTGISEKVDYLQSQINTDNNFISDLIKVLEGYIDDRKYFKVSKKEVHLINLKFNERDGHYLLLTNRRLGILKKKLGDTKELQINQNKKLFIKDLEFIELPRSSNTKIICPQMNQTSDNLIALQAKIQSVIKSEYIRVLSEIYEEYHDVITYWPDRIAYLDFINSGAILAKKHTYYRPKLVDDEVSFFTAKKMRHPIVERIHQSVDYKTHDIGLGGPNQEDGILLYGINSSGKSTLMKAIGLNIILAQIGYYVPCEELILSPYQSLFTRISGNDNIFRGLSSFMVESIELRAILTRNNPKTLVICDEICRGTEVKSANIIVVYMLEKLAKQKSSFISATHLHQLVEFESIKKLERVQPYYIEVSYDSENDNLIFERHLKKGTGETFYGLQVAKYIMNDSNFNQRTGELIEEYDILNENKTEIEPSNYNKEHYLKECYICEKKKKLEVHHICWQKDCKDGIVLSKPHIKKNQKSNLVTLCVKCHDKIDRNEIVITGWKDTSKGRLLDWKLGNKISQKKYNEESVMLINSLKEMSLKDAKKLLKTKHNMKISTTTISKIWNSNY